MDWLRISIKKDLNELQASVRGEITHGRMIEVNPATALKAVTDNPPYAWSIHATTQFVIKHYEEFNHKLELYGSLQISYILTQFLWVNRRGPRA